MKTLLRGALAAAAIAAAPASATIVSWTDWTDEGINEVNGTLDVGGTAVGVTFTGEYVFTQLDGTGTDFWTEGNPPAYTGGEVENAPGGTDLVALSAGGTKTITFDQAVTNPYLALVSWNGNVVEFEQAFEVISQGCGYWGCGSFNDLTPTSFVGFDELHGVIRFTGTFTSITFTDTTEGWHGFTVGVGGLAAPVVPEPASWAMMIAGFGLVGGALRSRRAGALAAA